MCECVYRDAREVTLRELTGSYGAVGLVGLGTASVQERAVFVGLLFSYFRLNSFDLIPSIFLGDLDTSCIMSVNLLFHNFK